MTRYMLTYANGVAKPLPAFGYRTDDRALTPNGWGPLVYRTWREARTATARVHDTANVVWTELKREYNDAGRQTSETMTSFTRQHNDTYMYVRTTITREDS